MKKRGTKKLHWEGWKRQKGKKKEKEERLLKYEPENLSSYFQRAACLGQLADLLEMSKNIFSRSLSVSLTDLVRSLYHFSLLLYLIDFIHCLLTSLYSYSVCLIKHIRSLYRPNFHCSLSVSLTNLFAFCLPQKPCSLSIFPRQLFFCSI